MSLADETGTDVEIYRRHGDDGVYADSHTGAPEQLLALLDRLGLERHTMPHAYVWHRTPERLSEPEKMRLASRAAVVLAAAGYRANIDPGVFDRAAHDTAVAELAPRRSAARPSPAPAPPAGSTPVSRPLPLTIRRKP
ncbi:hypothetical protein [Streptomyces sp. AK02-01A]|uniref:hypothetical protein n=1 Tax=Streptomyces sp. AK02-01A TaxID=3028648 RepID=UPI0029B30CCC|nr:hypothetical protein [Streptomyces sp. AK02-01A]MDX3855659.1 hypothetical protein [Streptomyces sp. AK02-01A]